MLNKRYTLLTSALLLVGLAAAGTSAVVHSNDSVVQPLSHNAPHAENNPLIVQGLPDFTKLVEQIGPSVVNIRTLERIKVRSSDGEMNPFGGIDPNILEFFRRFGMPIPEMPAPPNESRRERKSEPQEIERPRGVGSGFILSDDGYIMTNAHVVEGATDVVVTLTDRKEFKAKIVGQDRRTDIAVLKIDAHNLPFVKMGDVSRLRVGEWVIAIGSPFGLENSVTAGIVSAKSRDTGEFLPFIQTDVAINPGNAGGPLINMRGEVVGINSQIVTRSGGYNGISLSIPIDEASRIADQLRTEGHVARGQIGVEVQGISAELAQSLNLPNGEGALVNRVIPNAPAAKAGIEPGDIIVQFDGKNITRLSDLPRAVGSTKPNSKTHVRVFRLGKELDLPITVAAMATEGNSQSSKEQERDKKERPSSPTAYPAARKLGMELGDLSDAQKKELQLKGGARVEATEGVAANAGLRRGDIIVAITNTAIFSAQDAEGILSKLGSHKTIVLKIRRNDRGNYVLLEPPTEDNKSTK